MEVPLVVANNSSSNKEASPEVEGNSSNFKLVVAVVIHLVAFHSVDSVHLCGWALPGVVRDWDTPSVFHFRASRLGMGNMALDDRRDDDHDLLWVELSQ